MTDQPDKAAPFRRLSIVMPMWNEEAYVERAVRAAREACERLTAAGTVLDHEIVIVDDASTDRTPEIADGLADADPHLVVIHHPANRALGGSIRSGLARASGDVVLYTDADLPFDLLELDRACHILRVYQADVLSAYRHDRTGEGPRRAAYSWGYNWLVQALFGIRLRDVNFAFKLIRRCVLDEVELSSEGSFVDVELLVRAQRMGFTMVQIGVDYFPRTRGVSTLSSPEVIRSIVAEMASQYRELRALRPPVR